MTRNTALPPLRWVVPARGPRSIFVLTLLFATAIPAAGFAQGFRFRAAATRVIVDVLVLDSDGVPVPGLTRGDFVLFEDGTEQRVASLDVVDWERYEAGADELAAATPEATPALDIREAERGNVSPRRFVIVFNRRRADPVNLRRAKRGLEEFVTTNMVDGDETMILEFANQVRVLQEFTSGKQETLAAVRRIVPGTYESPVPEQDARQSFQMLYALAEALEAVEGRKIVVFMSMELMTFADVRQVVAEVAGDAVEGFPGRSALDETNMLRAAIQQLNHANATLYSVDIIGVYANENRILTPSLNAFDSLGNPLPLEPSDHPLTRMATAANVPAEGGAASLAVATGGTHFPNQTNFAIALNRIGIQNELYYLLSFSPANTELDGAYRNIEVRVRGDHDYRVIARPGYFARQRRGEEIEATARGEYGYAYPDALHTYAYLLNPRPEGAFGVLAAALPDSYLDEPAEARLRVIGDGGEIHSEATGLVDGRRFWISTPAVLPPGDHALELMVERGDSVVHRASSTLTIPAALGDRFSLSSVFPFVAEEHGPEVQGPPVRPVAAFAGGEETRLAFFIYPGRTEPASQVRIAYEIRNERGDVSVEAERPGLFDLDPQRFEGTPIALPIETAALRAGRYTAVIRVTDDARDRTASGELDFLIR